MKRALTALGAVALATPAAAVSTAAALPAAVLAACWLLGQAADSLRPAAQEIPR